MDKKDIMVKAKYMLRFLSDETYIKIYYMLKFHKKLNLKRPITFNEKIQWLKLNDRKKIYTKLVDKYEVRQYIKEKIGEKYLVPIYGVWEKFDDIDFEKLPEKFVLKCTHDSGGIYICKDKKEFDKNNAKRKIEKCLKNNFYYIAREWPYKNVKPRIIAEQYLEDATSKNGLIDYKFMCFNQKAKCCFACFGRDEKGKVLINIYDNNWEKMKFDRKGESSNQILAKPQNYEKMIELAQILSVDMPFSRIDFYEIDGKIYFGEITLYPTGGFKRFEPDEYDKILGDWLILPNINKSKGTGLKDKALKKAEKLHFKLYKIITAFTYSLKEKKEFKNFKKLDSKYKEEIKKYWKKYNININLKEFEFYNSRNARQDSRYITKRIFHSKIEPYYNKYLLANAFCDKNYLDIYLNNSNVPYSVIRNIDGTLLNNNYELIDKQQAIDTLLEENTELILKPSTDSGGGRDILFIDPQKKEEAKKTINEYINNTKNENYVIQRVIKQHEEYSKFNKTSVNTVRVLSFLYKDKVHILYSVLRIGKNGSRVDNASSGGYQIVINNKGIITDYIVNINNEKVESEEIKEKFINKKLPFYGEIINEIKKLHPKVAHFKLIGWDITINELEQPIIVEINIKDIGMSDKSQVINGPLFGELTDEVLDEVFSKNK